MKPLLAAGLIASSLGSLSPAFAQGANPALQGVFCSAEGRGFWAGADRAFRFQSSWLALDVYNQLDAELVLYADETPAAVFPLARTSDGWEVRDGRENGPMLTLLNRQSLRIDFQGKTYFGSCD